MPRDRIQTDNPEAVVESLQTGDERTLARVLTLVENRGEGYERVLDSAYSRAGNAWRIGLTGPPGAGKSTLGARLIQSFLAAGRSVAYVGVDPSSPFSGGALLGDRVRLQQEDEHRRFFARSIATRGAQGGLSEQTEATIDVLDAAGFEVVIVESIGVGQAEIDISHVVDTVVIVLVPESGDEIQTMKAGLLEIGDVLCVNKSDRANAGALVAALRASLAMRAPGSREWKPVVVSTTALPPGDISKLEDELRRHESYLRQTDEWVRFRRDRLRRRVRALVATAWLDRFWTADRELRLESALQRMDSRPRPYELAAHILSEDGSE